jgi:hypothetical protein
MVIVEPNCDIKGDIKMEFNAKYESIGNTLEFLEGASVGEYTGLTGVKLKVDGGTSDGYHTFDELYHHRMILFSIICNQNKDVSWKSKLHHDGTMYDNYFIVGISTSEGDYTYHYHLDNWNYFDVKVLPKAPEWDGHKPEDIIRLLTLV